METCCVNLNRRSIWVLGWLVVLHLSDFLCIAVAHAYQVVAPPNYTSMLGQIKSNIKIGILKS